MIMLQKPRQSTYTESPRGVILLARPSLNKGRAFTEDERSRLGMGTKPGLNFGMKTAGAPMVPGPAGMQPTPGMTAPGKTAPTPMFLKGVVVAGQGSGLLSQVGLFLGTGLIAGYGRQRQEKCWLGGVNGCETDVWERFVTSNDACCLVNEPCQEPLDSTSWPSFSLPWPRSSWPFLW